MMRRAPWLVVVLALLGAACGGGKMRYRPPRTGPLEPLAVMQAHFIDVGQGDATLLEFPCAAALIDTGGEQNGGFDSTAALTAYLDAFFARRTDLDRTLALVVISHSHIDHTRGLPAVMERYKVLNVIDGGREQSSGGADIARLHELVRQHPEIHHRDVTLGDIDWKHGLTDEIIDPIRCPDVDPDIRVLWGSVSGDVGWRDTQWGKPVDNENNHSLVVRVEFGRSTFLFTGDLEEQALDTLVARYRGTPLLDVDVYKVGHHGSRNGTTEPLVRAMTPRIAVFSVGSPIRRYDWTAWQYGHPGGGVAELLGRFLQDHRAPISVLVGRRSMDFNPLVIQAAEYATAWDGTVTVEANTRGRLKVTTSAAPPAAQAAGN